VFLLMAGAGLATAAVQFTRLRPTLKPLPKAILADVCRQHWQYGRWILASSFVVWIPSNFYYVLFSRDPMMSLAAELRALLNLTLPVAQTATALSLLVQPYVARQQSCYGTSAMASVVRGTTVLYAAGATAYWLTLLVFSKQAFHILYGDHYTQLKFLVPWVALSSILAVAAHGPGAGLRAIRSPASVFRAFCVASAISVVVGIPATLVYGVSGAVATQVAANTVAMILLLRSFYRRVELFSDPEVSTANPSMIIAMEQ